MEGSSSVNGRASGRTARERFDRKRAKKRSKRDLELRFDDLPSPAYDDSFYRAPVDRKRSRSHGLMWDSGYDSSDEADTWVRRVTCDGRCLDERREQDRRAGVGALGRLPKPSRSRGPRQQQGSSSKQLAGQPNVLQQALKLPQLARAWDAKPAVPNPPPQNTAAACLQEAGQRCVSPTPE